MRPAWVIWMPVTLLTLAAGFFAYRAGLATANMTETDVINHYAALYVSEGREGSKASDCAALPGSNAQVWLVITCGGAAQVVQYRVDRFGRLLNGPEAERPET